VIRKEDLTATAEREREHLKVCKTLRKYMEELIV